VDWSLNVHNHIMVRLRNSRHIFHTEATFNLVKHKLTDAWSHVRCCLRLFTQIQINIYTGEKTNNYTENNRSCSTTWGIEMLGVPYHKSPSETSVENIFLMRPALLQSQWACTKQKWVKNSRHESVLRMNKTVYGCCRWIKDRNDNRLFGQRNDSSWTGNKRTNLATS